MEGKSEKLPKPLLTNDLVMIDIAPAGNYMFKVNNRNTRTMCEICSNLTIETLDRRHRLA